MFLVGFLGGTLGSQRQFFLPYALDAVSKFAALAHLAPVQPEQDASPRHVL
jgi:hypothetical protein